MSSEMATYLAFFDRDMTYYNCTVSVNVWVSSPERPGQGQLWQCQSADTGQPPPVHHHSPIGDTSHTGDDATLQGKTTE